MTTNDYSYLEEKEEEEEEEDKGYDYEFADPGPSDDQICPICRHVARKACQVNCCGKIFCNGCLEKLRQYSDEFKCPNCRKKLDGKYFRDIRIEREIFHLKIYCNNKNKGCSWQGNLKDVDTHIKECPNQLVTCVKCNDIMQRHRLKFHNVSECLQRYYRCLHCNASGTYMVMISSHLEECPDLDLNCPNKGCKYKIKRRYMGFHQQICTKAVIKCPYHDIGCQMEMKREMMDEHVETSNHTHLQLAVKKIREITEEQQTVIKFIGFLKHVRDEDKWYSSGFYSSTGGYKLRLTLSANGSGNGKGTHVSCSVNLMPGEYDDTLEWPFQGEVIVELLNQLEDKNHLKQVIPFNDVTPDKYKNRKKQEDYKIWGLSQFIPHTDLGLNSSTNTQYLMNNTLYFRVSVNVHSKTKPWLAGKK